MKKDIKELTLSELEMVLESRQEPRFHARQIFSWIYQRGRNDFSAMSDVPASLREALRNSFEIHVLSLIKKIESSDGTEKFLLKLNDAHAVEAVSIPSAKRITGCVSTQVGCKFACRFCASGTLGFKRNLTAGEIIDEVLYLKNNSKEHALTHLVCMGMGEPLENYDNVIKAMRIINSPYSLNIGARRITISTAGVIPGIEKLAREALQIELSISLHAADDETRSRLMPINKTYPLKDLLACCRSYIEKTGRQITFEYTLIKGINSDLQNAQRLSVMLKRLNCKVNLIPCNSVKERNVEPPKHAEIAMFREHLLKSGIKVTLRKPRGQDIEAACGQLRSRYG